MSNKGAGNTLYYAIPINSNKNATSKNKLQVVLSNHYVFDSFNQYMRRSMEYYFLYPVLTVELFVEKN